MESIDMLIAFSLVAVFMLGVHVLSFYFAEASKQAEVVAASKLDAQEVLKKIIQAPGDPPDWTDINQVNSLGLADPALPGLLDPKKIMALAAASGVRPEAVCRIRAAGNDYPVTKVGYGIYIWGAPEPQAVDPLVYERILRSLFGDDWDKYDIELIIRPALNINLQLSGSQVFIAVNPPGEYSYDLCYIYWPAGSPVQMAPAMKCASGVTGLDGRGAATVPGSALFAYAYVRGVMLRGVNYTYYGAGGVSPVGLVARPQRGVYVIHSKLLQNAERGASLCGYDGQGVFALGLRYLRLFLGGQSVPLLENVDIEPAQNIDLDKECKRGKRFNGGCIVPWSNIGRAKFLIAAVERNSEGQPPSGIPQRDIIVMPLVGGLPPLYEVRFATWARWVGQRPEALAVSHASGVADAGEITYVVDLWVFRYP